MTSSKVSPENSNNASDFVTDPTFEEMLLSKYYNSDGNKYDPQASPSVYLIDKVLPGGKQRRKPLKMADYLRFDSIADVATFSFVDKAKGGGYFVYGGDKYDGVKLLDVPAEEIKDVAYVHSSKRKTNSFDPETLPSTSEIQQKTIIRADESIEKEEVEIEFKVNPYNPSAELKVNHGIHNEIQISAKNENGESDWETATLISRGNWRSTVDVDDQRFSEPVLLKNYMQFRDLDGDRMSYIRVVDSNDDPNSGYLTIGKRKFQGSRLELKSSLFRKVKYVPGDISQSDELTFQASDGVAAGVPATAVWGLEKNIKPEVKISDELFKYNEGLPIPLSSLLRVRDSNQNDDLTLSLAHINKQTSSGRFLKNGKQISVDDLQEISINDLPNVSWKPGFPGAIDEITVSVSDGLSEVVKTKIFSTEQTVAPRFELADLDVSPNLVRKSISVENLISESSQNKDLISSYTFDLLGKDGHFLFNGKKFTEKSEPLIVDVDDLEKLKFIPAAPGKAAQVTVTASDGMKNSKQVIASWGAQSIRENLEFRQSEVASIISSNGTIDLLKNVDPKLPGLPEDFSVMDKALDNIKSTKDVSTAKVKSGTKFSKISNTLLTLGALNANNIKDLNSNLINDLKGVSKRDEGESDFSWFNTIPLFDNDINSNRLDFINKPWFIENLQAGHFITVEGLGIDRTWGLGEFLGLPNSNSWDLFLGPDESMNPRTGNPSIGGGRSCGPWPLDDVCWRWPEVGASYSTGNNKLKAGLDINAEYSLGQMDIKAGGLVDVNYTPITGIWVTPRFENPSLDLTLPYAKLKLDAAYDVRFNPSLSAYVRHAGPFNFRTGNLLSPINFSESGSRNFVDIDTRVHTGASLSKEFNLASFTAEMSLPEFGNFRRQNQEGRELRELPEWRDATGSSITWGLDDRAELMDFRLSLGELATAFGIPLVLDDDWGLVNYRFVLADANLSLEADLDYNITVSMKPNIYATVEGSNQRYDVVSGFSVPSNIYRDVNDDGFVDIDMVVDPVIGYNISAAVRGGLNSDFSAIELEVGVPDFDFNEGFGPLLGPLELELGNASKILFEDAGVMFLSDVSRNLVDSLSEKIKIPIA